MLCQNKKFFDFFAWVMFKLSLDAAYFFVADRFADYIFFSGTNFNLIKYCESWIILFLIFFLMPGKKIVSSAIVWLLLAVSYVPMLTLYGFLDKPRIYIWAVTLFWLLVFFLLAIMPRPKLKFLFPRQSVLVCGFIFAAMSFLGMSLLFLGIKFSINFNLVEVYRVREAFAAAKIFLGGYLFNWLAYVANSFFAVWAVKNKKWWLLLSVILSQSIIFFATGNKIFLFSLFLVLGLYFIARRKNVISLMFGGFSLVVFLGIAVYYVMGSEWVYFLFTRRFMMVPAQLSYLYYDFFSANPFLFLSEHGVVKSLFHYSYDMSPGHLIAKTYFNRPETNAVNGIYADGFMNFGFLGMALWGCVLSFLLIVVDALSRGKSFCFCFALMAMPAVVFTESGLLTVMLTHGFLFALLLLYLAPVETEGYSGNGLLRGSPKNE